MKGYIKLRKKALDDLNSKLSSKLSYHSVDHTLGALQTCELYLKHLNIDKYQAKLLRVGILFHDIGFTATIVEHEAKGAEIATKMMSDLEQSQIQTNGLFLNADAGFDSEGFRKVCLSKGIIANIDFNKRNYKNTDNQPLLDDQLYKERFSVERTNAWIDAFKALLVRFETKSHTWMSLHHLAFSLILIRVQTNHF